jgi:hypothetical protein
MSIEHEARDINIREAVDFLLHQEYVREFEIIDGLNKHPKGYTFDEWLRCYKFI